MAANAPCPDCGADFPEAGGVTHKYLGGSPECWAAFNELLAREFQDVTYYKVHRYTVDAYTAQHPGDQSDRRAAQSVNIHLTALYLLLEEGRDESYARHALGVLANRFKGQFEPLDPPAAYDRTVKDVLAAKNAEEHCGLVLAWAESVWRAWEANHEVARAHARRVAS